MLGLIVAVNVTDAPNADGFREEASDMVVALLVTVCVIVLDVDGP